MALVWTDIAQNGHGGLLRITSRHGAVVRLDFVDETQAERAAEILAQGELTQPSQRVWLRKKWASLAPGVVVMVAVLLVNRLGIPLSLALAALISSPMFVVGYRRAVVARDGITIYEMRGRRVLRTDQMVDVTNDYSGVQVAFNTGETICLSSRKPMNQYLANYLQMRINPRKSKQS
jgi:hypothetical protein